MNFKLLLIFFTLLIISGCTLVIPSSQQTQEVQRNQEAKTKVQAEQLNQLYIENQKLRERNNKTIESYESVLQQVKRDQEIMQSNQKYNECLIKHADAKQSCNILYQGEPNGIALQMKIRQCISARGFPDGQDSCNY